MKVYVQVNENNKVIACSFMENPDDIEVEVEDGVTDLLSYYLIDGKLVRDVGGILENEKNRKKEELNIACNEAILDGFVYEVNGEKYKFSFDTEAQFNFQGAERILSKGLVGDISWTVKKDDEYHRIKISKQTMDELMIVIFLHKDRNIRKYREMLIPMVENANTVEEVQSVTWDSVTLSNEISTNI